MLTLPTRNGWLVEWENGKVRKVKAKDGTVIREVPLRDTFTTSDHSKALEKADEKRRNGYKNVVIYECIY